MTPAASKIPPTSRIARTLACAATLALVALVAHAFPALAAPDLIVESLTLNPTTCANGTAVEITATIHNQGDSAADPSVTRIRINQDPATVGPDDTKLCSSLPTASLAPGASIEVVCTPTITGRPEGTNYVWAIADVNKEIGQVDTTNDRAPAALEVTAVQASDLIID
ncbi:MAG: hypothetical protein HY899_03000, partial [Deltaproteobacteria bacterium]|nr:hypothetical protein [Deltaproteobacteria bacterium]